MSDRPHGSDWWQASDGRWYPPEVRPGPSRIAQPVPDSPAPQPLSPGLVAATQAALLSAAGLSAFAAAALAAESSRFDTTEVASAPDIATALGVAASALGVSIMALLGGFVMLVVWEYRAYRAARRRGPSGTAWSPGWAVGGWFIPLANLVIPKLVVGEIDRISHPAAGPEPIEHRWKTAPTSMLGHWWWACTVVGAGVFAFGFGVVVSQLDGLTLDEQVYRAGIQATAAGLALEAGGAALGAVMVGRIGSRLVGPPAIDSAPTIR